MIALAPADDDARPEAAGPEAESVETVITPERGRWLVEIVVVFPDGVVRHRIDTFPTRERAELSARLMKRAAERDLEGPRRG